MILYRTVFQAKFGKADDVVAALKESISKAPDEQIAPLQPRILTDLSGSLDTVVVETTHESLAAYEQFRQVLFAMAAAAEGPSALADLIETGRNEYWTIEL